MQTQLLKFPTDYPIKVVGRASPELRAAVDVLIARHVPGYDSSRTTERLSANGNFLSISYTIWAVSAEQVTGLAAELTRTEGVLIVI